MESLKTDAENDVELRENVMKDYNDVTKSTPRENKDVEEERETWGKKADFLLSVIGFAVDLANVWRFPYLCYKNGGGAFLIPYALMLIFAGIPLFYMELVLGQFHRKGAITCWGRICPLFKGIGYSVVLIAFYTDFFYNVIIAWSLYFFFASFTTELPWSHCRNSWNTENCVDSVKTLEMLTTIAPMNTSNQTLYSYNGTMLNGSSTIWGWLNTTSNTTIVKNATKGVSPALEYFERKMLEISKSSGLDDMGTVKWEMALCLLAVYVICYFSLWKGISTSGKVVWFTAIFPYVVLFILLIRGVTLDGAVDGMKYYLKPDLNKMKKAEVWVDAATQVFFSLGPGFGVLLAFSSYNKFHNNVYKDAIATSLINCATSFLSGFVIFSVLGYMAKKTGRAIQEVAVEGPGLVFVVYPEAISTLPGSTFWAIIFFLMLITLGLDSSFGGSEAIITALSDEFPIIKRKREIFVGVLFALYFLIGLASCSYGGAFVVHLMDSYAAGYSILFAVFFETLVVSWVYGVNRFCDDIKQMIGFRPGFYWRICWKFIAPLFIMFIIVFGLVMYKPIEYGDYVYPPWANGIGWAMALSSVLCIPGMALWKVAITPGSSLLYRIKVNLKPWRDQIVPRTDGYRLNGRGTADQV